MLFFSLVVVNMLNSKHDPKALKKAFNSDFIHKIFCFYCNQRAQVSGWALWFSKTVALCGCVIPLCNLECWCRWRARHGPCTHQLAPDWTFLAITGSDVKAHWSLRLSGAELLWSQHWWSHREILQKSTTNLKFQFLYHLLNISTNMCLLPCN